MENKLKHVAGEVNHIRHPEQLREIIEAQNQKGEEEIRSAKKDYTYTEGLGKLIKDTRGDIGNIYDDKSLRTEKSLILPRTIKDVTLLKSIKRIPEQLKKLNVIETRTIDGWEFCFNIYEAEGLKTELEKQGAKVEDHQNGTWTISK